jgi:hypothetical protein
MDEKVNFQMNGVDLLMRDFNIFCSTKTNSRAIMEQMKQLAMSNNTTGASIYDLGNIIKSESIAELTGVLKGAEEKTNSQRQAELQQQQQMQQELIESQEREKQMDLQFKAEQANLDRQTEVLVAEIRAAGYGSAVDINKNEQSDYQDALNKIQQQGNYQQTMNFKREQEINKNSISQEQLRLKQEELRTRERIAEKQLDIARTNKNKYDVKKPDNKKKK